MATPAEKLELYRDDASSQTRSVAVLDLVHLSRQTLGDAALETELLALFDKQSHQLAQRLSEPLGAHESKQRADLAQMLKGSAKAIGAFGVADAADVYEHCLRANLGDGAAELRRLVAAIAQARTAIADLMEKA